MLLSNINHFRKASNNFAQIADIFKKAQVKIHCKSLI